MKDKNGLNQKVKVLGKLYENGCLNEKDLQALNMESILKIPGITIPDMTIILELQKETKASRLFSYLGGGLENEDIRE